MKRLLIACAPLALAGPALAAPDPHAGHRMPGMAMPAAPKPMAKGPQRRTPAKAAPDVGRRKSGQKPVAATHTGHDRRGTAMPAPAAIDAGGGRARPAPVVDPHAGHDMSGRSVPAVDLHAGHDMGSMAVPTPAAPDATDPHAGHAMRAMDHGAMPGMAGMNHAATGTALEAGDAPAPAAPADRWADRYFAPADMRRARDISRREHGGGAFSQIMFNLAEYQVRNGRDGYRWDGEGWFGGDIDRLTVKTEGEGTRGGGVNAAEVQALWSHALDPYWNLQAGARVDVRPGPTRTYATIGVEGLAPYWFEVEGALFLSDKGDVLGRVEAYYDQRLTQRLFLQPRVELNLAAQDVPENGIGSGLSNAEVGLRLRYEVAREFAPYVGVSWDRKVGDTARYARAAGEGAGDTSFVAGIRFWF